MFGAANKFAFPKLLAACLCLSCVGVKVQFRLRVRSPRSLTTLTAMALAALPAQGLASDVDSLLVGSIALGISGVLIIQALIGVTLVVQKKYTFKDPSHFIAIAVVFLLIGTIAVLSEVTSLAFKDVISLLALMYLLAVCAIFPPLLQRLRTEKTSRRMRPAAGEGKARRVALTLSLLAFGLMSVVSLLLFITGEQSGVVDCLLLLGAPFVLAVLAYVAGLWHKPEASS